MHRDDLKIDGHYSAIVDRDYTIVKIDAIKDAIIYLRPVKTGQKSTRVVHHYHVTDTKTGNKFVFKSQLRFHNRIK